VEVTEGWEGKLKGVLVGYSIVFVIVALVFIASIIFAILDAKKLLTLQEANKKLEIASKMTEKDIETNEARVRHNEIVRKKEAHEVVQEN
jgi:hypothetical protein